MRKGLVWFDASDGNTSLLQWDSKRTRTWNDLSHRCIVTRQPEADLPKQESIAAYGFRHDLEVDRAGVTVAMVGSLSHAVLRFPAVQRPAQQCIVE